MREPPNFVMETSEPDQAKRWAWMMRAAEEGARSGNAYFIVSFDQQTMTVRMEGWETRPNDLGEGV